MRKTKEPTATPPKRLTCSWTLTTTDEDGQTTTATVDNHLYGGDIKATDQVDGIEYTVQTCVVCGRKRLV